MATIHRPLKIIALIPARGGSKGVPMKNLRPLAKKPLISWSIEVAKALSQIDAVCVSTDSLEIGKLAESQDCLFIQRPDELATDTSLVIDTVKHAIHYLEKKYNRPDVVILLEPTCPFRNADDIQKCLSLLSDDVDSVATFTEAVLHPHRAWKIDGESPQSFISDVNPWAPRQTLQKAFQLNGGVYAFRTAAILKSEKSFLVGKNKVVIMPPERSFDIDTEWDFISAETFLNLHKETRPKA